MIDWHEVESDEEDPGVRQTYRAFRGDQWCYLHLHRLPDGSWDAIIYDEATRMLDQSHVDTPNEARFWAQRRLEAMFAE
jgi:hypothetical protein